jgi:hypothetical protein
MQEERPNRESNQEPAEGSPGGTTRESQLPPESFGEGGGITNRPIEEETRNQDRVPPRGGRKEDVERETPDGAQENPVLPGDDARTRTEI